MGVASASNAHAICVLSRMCNKYLAESGDDNVHVSVYSDALVMWYAVTAMYTEYIWLRLAMCSQVHFRAPDCEKPV